MGGVEPAGGYVRELLRAGKPVVSANKQLVAREGADLFAVASAAGVQLRFEASVCAAVPVVKVQRESLTQLARLETRTSEGPKRPPAEDQAPGPRMTRLEHPPTAEGDPYQLRSVRERLEQLSPKQRDLLKALEGSDTVSQAAADLGVSRSNVYASLRRISRKLGVRSVPELLAIVRTGELFPSPSP